MADKTDYAYMRAYMDGYTAALAEHEGSAKQEKPYVAKEDIIKRYGGHIGINKAGQIMRDVRKACNGGKLDSCSIILLSELKYWEELVEKKYVERL